MDTTPPPPPPNDKHTLPPQTPNTYIEWCSLNYGIGLHI